MTMRWGLRKLRKMAPVFLLLATIYFLYKKSFYKTPTVTDGLTKEEIVTRRFLRAPTHPPPPRQWLLIQETSADCSGLALTFPDWNILFVAPAVTGRNTRCHVLSQTETDTLFQSSDVSNDMEIPRSLFAAFLYLVKVDAEVIYLAGSGSLDEEVDFLKYITRSVTKGTVQGLVASSRLKSMLDVTSVYGCNRTLYETDVPASAISYSFCHHKTPVIYSPGQLRYKNSDTTDTSRSDTPECDTTGPVITVQTGTFVNLQLYNSAILYDAIWSLPLLASSQPSFNFLAQSLMGLCGGKVAVFAPLSASPSSYRKATKNNVVNLLLDWVCDDTQLFRSCILTLLKRMASELGTASSLLKFMTLWLDALDKAGYKWPRLGRQHNKDQCMEEPVTLNLIDFSKMSHRSLSKVYTPVENLPLVTKLYETTCLDLSKKQSKSLDYARPWTQFDDILLVVVFNNPHYDSIPYIETLYRSLFPRILYCGPEVPDYVRFPEIRDYRISFVSYGNTPEKHVKGAFNYRCVAMAVRMRFGVKGYLTIADDTFLFSHPLTNFPKHTMWFLPEKELRIGDIRKLKECRLGMCDFYPHWDWWEDYQNATLSVLRKLKTMQTYSPIAFRCYQQLELLNGGEYRPNGGYSDIYYIPKRLANDFADLADVFLRYEVFLEIAVPTIIHCIELPQDTQPLHGKPIWEISRDSPWIYFNRDTLGGKVYLHPTKWSYLSKGVRAYRDFFCSAIEYIYDPYPKLKHIKPKTIHKTKLLL